MVFTASSSALLQRIVNDLRSKFAVMDMGDLRFFLGIDVQHTAARFYLSQGRYAEEILQQAGMANCKPASTPIDRKGKLSADGSPVADTKMYRNIAGALQYLTITCPDLAFAVQQACLYMHDPWQQHSA
jgi:hypothetical protein